MQDNSTSPPTPTPWNTLRVLYLLMVVSDLIISWYRSLAHFNVGVLIFHVLETTIKLTTLLFVLRNRHWAYVVQVLLSLLAFHSSLALMGQENKRAVNDPLLWISLGVQIVAGVCCVLWLLKRTERAAS